MGGEEKKILKLKRRKIKKKKKKVEEEEQGKMTSILPIPEKAEEGMVLTLKDEEILDKEDITNNKINNKTSELEHSSWYDEQKSKEYKKGKRQVQKGRYGSFVDVDDDDEEENQWKSQQEE